jgi:hypothetical protein
MIGSTPGQKRTDPRRLPSPEDLPGERTAVVDVVGSRAATAGNIPAWGTRVVENGTGKVVGAGMRSVGSSASAIGTGSVPGVVLASGTVVVAVDKLGTAVAVAGVVVGAPSP